MPQVDWYFDVISPFAYLASQRLDRLPEGIAVRPVPVLFAGLLDHWHTKGPAEIAPMRRFTFRHIAWLARRDGIPLRFPPQHPFNPLRLLRLALLLDDLAAVRRLFRFVWAEGRSSDDPDAWASLGAEFGLDDVESAIAAPEIKTGLRGNTERAIALGVFGVPTFAVGDELFWGYDALPFLAEYLAEPARVRAEVLAPADAMREGRGRPGAAR
ncbi:MAG: 2-hydroxychromene-2-carboxylate isomerase [Gammaproteobacteria bacterium]|nr:2-hydroxychromene-2-carboxylate isomerase [Gammaproteobacteria bacterium]